MQVGKGILAYETAKNHLPGVLNQTPGGALYTWVEATLPFLDREDIGNLIRAYNVSQMQSSNTNVSGPAIKIAQTLQATNTMRLQFTVCPDDPYSADPSSPNAQALLSYGVNDGFFVSYVTNSGSPIPTTAGLPAVTNQPLDRNGNAVAAPILSRLASRPSAGFPRGQSVSSSVIIMIGEKTGDARAVTKTAPPPPPPPSGPSVPSPFAQTVPAPYYYQNAGNFPYGPGKWVEPNWNPTTAPPQALPTNWYGNDWTVLTFHWPISSDPGYLNPALPLPMSPYIMVSSHPGKVGVTYFDGHGEMISNETTFPR
jgi:prepilin-type processing-associated H-X9-DG protein